MIKFRVGDKIVFDRYEIVGGHWKPNALGGGATITDIGKEYKIIEVGDVLINLGGSYLESCHRGTLSHKDRKFYRVHLERIVERGHARIINAEEEALKEYQDKLAEAEAALEKYNKMKESNDA